MSFLANVFDLKKLAHNLDRTESCNAPAGDNNSSFSELSDYIVDNLLEPLLTDAVIKLDSIDFDLITDNDISDLQDAIYNACDSEIQVFRMCKSFCSFSPIAVDKPVVI